MGIYGYNADTFKYGKAFAILENTINDNRLFLESVAGEQVVSEGVKEVFRNIVERIKKVVKAVIDFLKSIPGRIKDFMSKIFNKNKKVEEEFKEKEKEPEFIFNDSKVYEEEVYNYTEMVGVMFNRSNFMMSENPIQYKTFTNIIESADEFEKNFGRHVNPNYFAKFKTADEWYKYINSPEYFSRFKINDTSAKKLESVKKDLDPGNLDYIQKNAADYSKSWENIYNNIQEFFKDDMVFTGDLLKTVAASKSYKDKITDAGMDEESLRGYLKYTTLSIFACQTVVNQSLKYMAAAQTQYYKVNNFLISCYEKNPNFKPAIA